MRRPDTRFLRSTPSTGAGAAVAGMPGLADATPPRGVKLKLLDLPPELLFKVLQWVAGPVELASVSQCCRTLRAVASSGELWSRARRNWASEMTDEAFERMNVLQPGNWRSVYLARHKSTGLVLAQKVIELTDGWPEALDDKAQKAMTEIGLLHKFSSPTIVNFYGAYVSPKGQEVTILMENMDVGCLNTVRRRRGRIPETILFEVARCTLLGLKYVFDQFNVIHRGIKPSNILANSKGDIKLCDFGVSNTLGSMELERGIVDFGPMIYLSPEQFQGEKYDSRAGLWSLGLTLLELATGNYQYPTSDPPKPLVPMRGPDDPAPPDPGPTKIPPFTFIQELLDGEPPKLAPAAAFSAEFSGFTDALLQKDPQNRASMASALGHKWIVESATTKRELAEYFRSSLPAGDAGVAAVAE